jgi:hypothetical protein
MVYVDDVNILDENMNTIKRNTQTFLRGSSPEYRTKS